MPDSRYYLQKLTKTFEAHRNAEKARSMEAYMRNQFVMLGIKTPERNEIFRGFIKEHGWPDLNTVDELVLELWALPEREYQYLALHILEKNIKHTKESDVNLYQALITEKSWWDTVDGLAATLCGYYFRYFPGNLEACSERWMNSGNIWLQRTLLLFQLKYKTETNTMLLEKYISQLYTSKEFFIQKGIGWILREYSKTNPQYVIEYVNRQALPALSKREALKVIQKKNVL